MKSKIQALCLGVILSLAAAPANAEYFFMVVGKIIFNECLKTAAQGPQKVEAMMERNPNVDCELDTSNTDYSVITCTSLQVTTSYLTDTEEDCEKLRLKVTKDKEK